MKSSKYPPIENIILTDVLFDGQSFKDFCNTISSNNKINPKYVNFNMCCILYLYYSKIS